MAEGTNKRPLGVMIVGWLYIAVGVGGFAAHFTALRGLDVWREGIPIELTELLAFISGLFLLRGRNWSRWLALAWIAFHVILSAFHARLELAVHCASCAIIAWVLFRPQAARYFERAPAPSEAS